jgi:hypothetical protein
MIRIGSFDYYQQDVCAVVRELYSLQIARFVLKDREVWAEGFPLIPAVDVGASTNIRDLVLMVDADVYQKKVVDLGPPVLVGDEIEQYDLIGKYFVGSQSAAKMLTMP